MRSLSVVNAVVIKTAVSAAGAAESGGRTPARTHRRLPSNIYSHAPAAALTARGAPVQIWQPWEVPSLLYPSLPYLALSYSILAACVCLSYGRYVIICCCHCIQLLT